MDSLEDEDSKEEDDGDELDSLLGDTFKKKSDDDKPNDDEDSDLDDDEDIDNLGDTDNEDSTDSIRDPLADDRMDIGLRRLPSDPISGDVAGNGNESSWFFSN